MDRTPSLEIKIGRNGNLLLYCHACKADAPAEKIIKAAGGSMAELFAPEVRTQYGEERKFIPRRIVRTYDYLDADGRLAYQKVRYEPKDFRNRRPDGRGDWIWNLDGVQRVLYRQAEVMAAPDWPVLLLEGEKDTDTAFDLGLIATTTIEGRGGGWDDDTYPSLLRGRRIVIIPDHDEAGYRRAEQLAGCLLWRGCKGLRIVHLPDVDRKGDLTQWVERQPQDDMDELAAALIALIKGHREWTPG